ncbi:MAG TPA: hypothetical protein VKV32_06690 [Stellaceae bacterium]|nr:hypothetical protein [Stellaceae bacterium]
MSAPGVLLVGSFPFKTAEEAFDVAGPALAGVAKRLPDGEAQGWVTFAGATLARAIGIEAKEQATQPRAPRFRLKPGVEAKDVRFAPVGYDQIALRSYDIFAKRRADGKISLATRFQVSLPTPFGILGHAVIPEHVGALLPYFEKSYLAEVETFLAAIPHQDLAIQWDLAIEIIACLLAATPGLAERFSMADLVQSIARVSQPIPREVELGIHFCYGNLGGRHVIEPESTALMVRFYNALGAAIARPIDWAHMPVPKNRADDAYFAPLQDLHLRPETELYLGLVHLDDGIEGTKRRIAAARRYISGFGVGWECGLRAFKPETIPAMLALQKEAALIV